MDLTTDNQEVEAYQETSQAEVQLIQEHTQTFIPILDRTASFSPLSFSPDPAHPQQKKLKRDRSLSPSSRLTVPYFVEAPRPISSQQQASIQKIATSTSPFWSDNDQDILPVRNFLRRYTPAKNFHQQKRPRALYARRAYNAKNQTHAIWAELVLLSAS